MSSDDLDVFIDELGLNQDPTQMNYYSSDVPIKALKKVMKLPSYQRQLEKHHNSHDLCKARMSKHVLQDQNAIIKQAISRARDLIFKESFLKAIELLDKIVNDGICHSDIFYLLGESFRLLNDADKAEIWVLRAMNMKIHPPQCYLAMGKICQFKEMYKESIGYFEEYLKRIEDLQVHYELGRSFLKLGEFEEAINEFTYFISQKRQSNLDPSVLVLRAEAFEAVDRADLARKDYKLILQINPNFYSPYIEHANNLAACGKFSESKSIIEFVRTRTRYV